MINRIYSQDGISIKDDRLNNLHIGWDEEDGFVMLFTPDMDDTIIHYHIELPEDTAKQLCLFIQKKLPDVGQPLEE